MFTEEEVLRMRQQARAEGIETAGYQRLWNELISEPSPEDSQTGEPS